MKDEITLVVHVSRELHKKLKIYCVNENKKIKDFVADIIKEKLKK